MGNTIKADGYLVRNASMKMEMKDKNLEFLLIANTVKYNAQIDKESAGISDNPILV